jgi:hypothetical protein
MTIMPEPKSVRADGGFSKKFDSVSFRPSTGSLADVKKLFELKLWDLPDIGVDLSNPFIIELVRTDTVPDSVDDAELYRKQGYTLIISDDKAEIQYTEPDGLINAFSTWKQTVVNSGELYKCGKAVIVDWPSVEFRSISTTFAWYAGYGRLGFDMQLWGYKEWKEFLLICSDFKINHMNMILYGYWPFEFPEYPESVLRGLKIKVWNEESGNWITVEYMHPNLDREFLKEIIAFGHDLGIKFFAYIGLNSYNGGYTNAHPEKRMKKPEGSHFINDFDSLCLSDEGSIDYLKACMRRIIDQGFDGFDFEESEEAYWYCNCDKCKETFWKDAKTPEETLHAANMTLLKILYDEIRATAPNSVIGIRAWRQPPLIRPDKLVKQMVDSIPDDVVLLWAPGQYVPESEFEKWVKAFGRGRVYARDTEAIGFASCWGRLVRLFKWNGLRCEEESITQFIEEDIRQHRGSAAMHVKGINGYQFEWYGYFMAFFAHSYFGWGGSREDEDFYQYALRSVFKELSDDIWFVLKNYFVIHESQIGLYEIEWPMARNKVEERDRPRIKQAIKDNPRLIDKLSGIRKTPMANPRLAHYEPHFKKLQTTLERSGVIYQMALASLELDKHTAASEREPLLRKIYDLNEADFDIVKRNYFDVNPTTETGVKSCMFPYHEIKRRVLNELDPEHSDNEPIYPGVESLGWLWV